MIIDAVCVRIMKGRKVEKHQELIQAIIHQVNMFQAQPPMIKKRVESLIEREYLERDKTDHSKYIYKP
jgi:cullin 3